MSRSTWRTRLRRGAFSSSVAARTRSSAVPLCSRAHAGHPRGTDRSRTAKHVRHARTWVHDPSATASEAPVALAARTAVVSEATWTSACVHGQDVTDTRSGCATRRETPTHAAQTFRHRFGTANRDGPGASVGCAAHSAAAEAAMSAAVGQHAKGLGTDPACQCGVVVPAHDSLLLLCTSCTPHRAGSRHGSVSHPPADASSRPIARTSRARGGKLPAGRQLVHGAKLNRFSVFVFVLRLRAAWRTHARGAGGRARQRWPYGHPPCAATGPRACLVKAHDEPVELQISPLQHRAPELLELLGKVTAGARRLCVALARFKAGAAHAAPHAVRRIVSGLRIQFHLKLGALVAKDQAAAGMRAQSPHPLSCP